MNTRLRFGLGLLCLLMACQVAAQDRVTIIRERDMADPAVRAAIFGTRGGDCNLGNPLEWEMTDNALEVEDGYYLVEPQEDCSCGQGVKIDELQHVFFVWNLLIPESWGGAGGGTLSVHGELMEAVWDPALGCWVPGQVYCSSPGYSLEVPQPCSSCMEMDNGFINWIGDLSSCECAYPEYPYFIHVHIEGGNPETNTRHEMPYDDAPPQCAGFGEDHNVFLTGSADCCDTPIGVTGTSWGAVKKTYR